jgi:uncharacterized membrane protein YfcA
VIEIVGLIVLGLVTGSLAASLGVGGGIIIVPALVTIFAFGQHEAIGTSLAIIVPTAAVSTLAHHRAGRVIWKLAAVVGVAGVIGAVAGVNAGLAMDPDLLRRLFAILLAALSIRMALRAKQLHAASRTLDRG